MFAVKIYNDKEERNDVFDKTIDNLISYIFEELNSKNIKTVSDDFCIEVISGSEPVPKDNEIVAELLIKKVVVINSEGLDDKAELDKYLSNIKHFCDQAKKIEEVQYLPITMREEEE